MFDCSQHVLLERRELFPLEDQQFKVDLE